MEGESWGVSAAIRGHRRVCSLLLRSSGHHANGGHLLCNDGPSCSHGYAGRQQAPQAGLPSELRGATHRRDHCLVLVFQENIMGATILNYTFFGWIGYMFLGVFLRMEAN